MLKVCVGREADDLHEGEVNAETRESLRIKRENVLEDEDDEGKAHLENVHNNRGEKILPPPHTTSRIYAKKLIDPILDRTENPIYPTRCASEDSGNVGCEQAPQNYRCEKNQY